jgi:YebC/PmpR family DNA-binding regulatory protein
MSGHNKWSKIKHKKAATDSQKSKIFSKLVKLIKVEAKISGGDTNSPSLKAAIEKAKQANMPKDNIDRAIKSASDGVVIEHVLFESYGPGGTALMIEGLTDNNNRTSQEIRHLLSQNGLELASPGSAAWAFKKIEGEWIPQTVVPIVEGDAEKLQKIIEELEDHDDIQNVYTNAE